MLLPPCVCPRDTPAAVCINRLCHAVTTHTPLVFHNTRYCLHVTVGYFIFLVCMLRINALQHADTPAFQISCRAFATTGSSWGQASRSSYRVRDCTCGL